MQVELLDYTEDPEYKIGLFSAECYDSKKDRESCIRRVKHCKDSGHLSTLRFANATFKISGISRVCSHQLVRSAHLSYLQKSQRYVFEKEIEFVEPDSLKDAPEYYRNAWRKLHADAEALYLAGINNKYIVKEDARFVLPQSCTTSIIVTGNFQALLDFINLRSSKYAQKEIRNVAIEINNQLAKIAPNIFEHKEFL